MAKPTKRPSRKTAAAALSAGTGGETHQTTNAAADNPAGIVATLLAALPPGSYLVASHVTADYNDPTSAADGVQAVQRAGVPILTRTADEFADLALAGLELVPPGLVPVSEWRPDTEPGLVPRPAEVAYYGAVAVKPARA